MFHDPQMRNLLIGNIISMAAACFTAAASLVHKKERIYTLQVWQCALLAIANIFFGSYAGITTLALCALRNILLVKDKYNFKVCIFFMAAVTAAGIACNNRAAIGMLPVIATLIYTLWSYFAKQEWSIKWNITINLLIWMLYEIFIRDYASLIMDGIAVVAAFFSMAQLIKAREKKEGSAS